MKTVIEEQRNLPSDAELESQWLKEEIGELKEEIVTLNEQLEDSLTEDDFDRYKTCLGDILVMNVKGNLQLQQEIDDFFELLIKKYN